MSLLSWILPLVLMFGFGRYMTRKLTERATGGGNSMMFGMGKSNAKVYVKSSSDGIRFSVPFFSISGSEFVEMFVGMGASKW